MKRTIVIVAIAAALVLSFAPAAFAVGPFFTGTYNTIYAGAGEYLDWDASVTNGLNTGSSPHGNYSASTNKCAVCHSVHMAAPDKAVLTAGPADGVYSNYTEGCAFCHAVGNTFTNVVVTLGAGGTISPHASGGCSMCHAANPHGVGTSSYPSLASRLLNSDADGHIAADIAASANGVDATTFDGVTNDPLGITLGTGYLCSVCHAQAYAVNEPGTDPNGGGAFTGHRVYASATNSWVGATYGASYDGDTVAWASATGCAECHDAVNASGGKVFPHNYVNAAGATVDKNTIGASLVWLTTADSATDATHDVLAKTAVDNSDENDLLTRDGLCIKCHRNDTTTTGVGLSY